MQTKKKVSLTIDRELYIAVEKAAKTFNMIILGAYLKVKPIVQMDNVLKGLKKSLPERHHHLMPMNEKAIKKGPGQVKLSRPFSFRQRHPAGPL